MGIKVSSEVHNIIQQMMVTTKKFELGMMNTLVLFDTLLLNRFFATSVEVSSACTLDEISKDVLQLLQCKDFDERKNTKNEQNIHNQFYEQEGESKEEKYIFKLLLQEACSKDGTELKSSQDLADVFTYAIQMTADEKRTEVTFEDIVVAFLEDLSKEMLYLFS